MKNTPFYRYSKTQRNGIITLFAVIIIIQAAYYVFNIVGVSSEENISETETQWLAHQTEINALKAKKSVKKDTIYPFNPNYITDYKGYVLGMSDSEIDRLLAFRKSGKWINSAADFKRVTGVPDSLLEKISPYFKFPDWVVEKNSQGMAQTDDDGYKKPLDMDNIQPFNPNFVSDNFGRGLGMTSQQIDRLKAYRESGKWINSPADFKNVTGISDELLNKISPYFKFPDWVIRKYQQGGVQIGKKQAVPSGQPKDINTALEEDLTEIYGVGPTSAKKIMRRRAVLGAFVSMEQMADFKEFSAKAVAGLQKGFKVGANPDINRINVNTASLEQLSRFPYFNKEIATAIINYRTGKGKISNFDELSKINDIFILKSKIISLYLEY